MCRLQAQNLSAVGRGCFVCRVEIDGEGLDMSLARGELCGRCYELLGRCVRLCRICLGDRHVPIIQHGAQEADILVYFYLHSRWRRGK